MISNEVRVAAEAYVAANGGERWEIPGDEAFMAGWYAAVNAGYAPRVITGVSRSESDTDTH